MLEMSSLIQMMGKVSLIVIRLLLLLRLLHTVSGPSTVSFSTLPNNNNNNNNKFPLLVMMLLMMWVFGVVCEVLWEERVSIL